MARKKRVWYPGAIYHVMSRGTRRMALFRDDEDYQTFLEFLCMIQEKRPFLLHAYCLMTNHFHMELETAGEPIWDIMKNLLGKYAGYYNFRHHFQGHLFESRYHAILIEETTYFLETSRYIHLNPVKAGIVNQPEEYRYSSYRYYVSGKEYTVAVLGHGLDKCYPKEHVRLMKAIEESGTLISEYIPGTPARKYHFPQRNRIIAALAAEVYVVEAGRNSGTHSTIEAGEKYGRSIIVVNVHR